MVDIGCLIPSMVYAGIYYGLASPPHAADEPADVMMRNLGPFLYECWPHSSTIACLSSWTVVGWTWREEIACSIGFKSGETPWSIHADYSCLLKISVCDEGSLCTGVITHKKEISDDCAKVRATYMDV